MVVGVERCMTCKTLCTRSVPTAGPQGQSRCWHLCEHAAPAIIVHRIQCPTAAITPGRLKERKTSRICINHSPLVTGESRHLVCGHAMKCKGHESVLTCLPTLPAVHTWCLLCVQRPCLTCSWGRSRWMNTASRM